MAFVYEFVESESDEVYLVQKNSIWLIIIGKSLRGQFEKSYNFMAIFVNFSKQVGIQKIIIIKDFITKA